MNNRPYQRMVWGIIVEISIYMAIPDYKSMLTDYKTHLQITPVQDRAYAHAGSGISGHMRIFNPVGAKMNMYKFINHSWFC